MCKHVAAVLYGIGARLDERPELLFRLRDVDEKQLIATAGTGLPLAKKGPAAEKVLDGGDLSAIFGLEMAQDAPPETESPEKKAKPRLGKMLTAKKTEAARAGRSKARSRSKKRTSRQDAKLPRTKNDERWHHQGGGG